MEQFRHIGEVVGSLKALMVLRDEIQINQRQCCLILDMFSLAMETIAEEIRQNLKLEERNTKWKPLEFPLQELYRVFKEGELYIRQCLDSKDWLGKAMILSQSRECVEFHIHNLLCYFPAVIEAIENAGEMSGSDPDEKEKKKLMLDRKYDLEWNDPKLFQWKFGKQYLVPREICKQLEHACREDRWRLVEAIKDKTKKTKGNNNAIANMLLKKLVNGSEINPISMLIGSKDYQVRRRLGRGKEFKEIQWLGQSFALRHFQTQTTHEHEAEVSTLLSLSHPNILQYLCGFYDQEKKEYSLVMELMSKDLRSYMKENCGPRRQIMFSIPVVVDLMLQIARGIDYIHSKNISHGQLNPFNILLKPRNSQQGYFQAKVSGFGLSFLNNNNCDTDIEDDHNPLTWYAPEVLTELEEMGYAHAASSSEKSDVYSFGMICFELLTGKVPFEDNHLQGDRTGQNIRAGGRPLFPYHSPKYLVNLIKKCWQTDPAQRPTFSSICRILRYTKKFLAINTDSHLQAPPIDFCDIEATFLNCFSSTAPSLVSQIPYEIFAYKVAEKERIKHGNTITTKDKCCEHQKTDDDVDDDVDDDDGVDSACEDPSPPICGVQDPPFRKTVKIKKPTHVKAKKEHGGRPKLLMAKSLPSSLNNRVLRTAKANNQSLLTPTSSTGRPPLVSESKGITPSSSIRRKKSEGNVWDVSKLKKKDQASPLNRCGSVAENLKTKKSQQLRTNPSLSSAGGLRRVKTETNLKGLTPSPSSSGHVSDLNNGLKMMTRGSRLSSFSLSPLSPPHARTRKIPSGHVSD